MTTKQNIYKGAHYLVDMKDHYALDNIIGAYQRGEKLQSSTRLAALAFLTALAVTGCARKTTPMKVNEAYCGVASGGTAEQNAFLDTIARAEGVGPGRRAYKRVVNGRVLKDPLKQAVRSGRRNYFKSYRQHPRILVRYNEKKKRNSTAAGRGQFLYKTYKWLKGKGLFPNGRFGPRQQDAAIRYLVRKKGVTQKRLEKAEDGSFNRVRKRVAGTWTSFKYKSNKDLQKQYQACLKVQRKKHPKKRKKNKKRSRNRRRR